MIQCLTVVQGGMLSDEDRTVLLAAAVELVRTGSVSKRFKGATCEGRVKTEFTMVNLASISGVKFFAQVDTQTGRTLKVHYLIRDRDLRDRVDEVSRALAVAQETGGVEWANSGLYFTEDDERAIVAARPQDVYVH